MKARFKIDLDKLDQITYTGSNNYVVDFNDIESFTDLAIQETDNLTITINSSYKELDFYMSSGGGINYRQNFADLSTNGIWIELIGDTDDFSSLQYMMDIGVITDIQPINNETLLYLYTQNSENDALNKSLTLVNIVSGKFNHSIGVKALNIDVVNIDMNFNYVYIPSLHRYYFVDSVEIISNDVRRLHLKEDVLMSWKDLIKRQSAQITRWEHSTEEYIIDDRFPLESRSHVRYETLNNTPSSDSLVNCTLDFTYNNSDLVYFVTTIATLESSYNYAVHSPTNSGLPDIYPRKNKSKHYYILNYEEYGYFNVACIKKDSTASFVLSALWLPFKVINTNGFIISTGTRRMFAGTDALTMNKTWEDAGSSGYTFVNVKEIDNGAIPYLVTQDFTFPNTDSFLQYQPYSTFELYIAFVGYVQLSVSQLAGKRCLVYYALDVETGSATCYLYNYTDQKVVFSQTCQMGIKQEFNTSNYYQNNIQRELLMMGTLFSGIQGVLSSGGAYGKGNYLGAIGGLIGVAGNIAKTPFQNALIQDTMNTSFGSSENALYSLYNSYLKITYRTAINMPDLSDYDHLQGKPYNKYFDVIPNYIYGYVEIGEIHFNPFDEVIYQDEITEIVALLKNGVIF